MTYSAYETSQEGSRPIELYEFTIGATVYRYTSAEDTQTISSVDYTPLAGLKRSKIGQGPEERRSTLTIDMPGSNAFVRPYIAAVPSNRATVTIMRLQRSDYPAPEVVTIFEGYVKAVNFDGDGGRMAKVAVEPAISATARSIPQFTFQGLCNHVLYDDQCQIDDTDPAYRTSLTVTVVTTVELTIPGLAAFGDGWFTGGVVEVNGGLDARLIIDHTADVLTLHIPFASAPLGQVVTVLAGCAHTLAICKSKFDNVINYGGFAFVPKINIFNTGLDAAVC
jgi:uncharacterized phage protein (TIGR02218 family)